MTCYETLENAWAERQDAQQRAREKAEDELIAAFLGACARMDAGAIAGFAPMVIDWEAKRRIDVVRPGVDPMRSQELWEVILDAAEFDKPGAGRRELVHALLGCAFGQDHAAAQQRVCDLLGKLAGVYAKEYAEVDE